MQFEIAVVVADFDCTAGKRIADCRCQLARITNGTNGFQRGREVHPVGAEDGRVGSNLWPARRRVAIGAEMIVKPPVAHALTQHQQFGRLARIAAVGHHAVERRELRQHLLPGACLVADADARAVARSKNARAREHLAGPLTLGLDCRIEGKGRCRAEAEINRVAIVRAGKAEL